MSGSLIILLVLSIALDFLAELGPFCICFYGSSRMQQARDFILSRGNSKYTFLLLHTGHHWNHLSTSH